MRPFEYARPESIDELLALLSAHGSNARLLAGGTDLLVRLRKRSAFGETGDMPEVVIDLKRVAGLRSDVKTMPAGIRIGARAVMTDVIAHETVLRYFPALIEAAIVVGSVQIRNRATVAGNICNASPAADTAPALLVYGASINVIGSGGSRQIPLDGLFAGPGRTVLARGEIVESIDLPLPPPRSGAAFGRLTRRHGVDLAIVSLCCLAQASGEVRLAFGAVGPRPFLVRDDTGILIDKRADPARRDAALQRLLTSAAPISDLRASDAYRYAMLPVLARRALRTAIGRMRAAREPA